MKTLLTIFSVCVFSFVLISCGSKTSKNIGKQSSVSETQPMEVQTKEEEPIANYVTDIDGNKYKIVTIGEQTWMAENLNVKHFRNGDEIPNIIDGEEWDDLGNDYGEAGKEWGKAAWCFPENNIESEKRYGRLYNGFAILDPRGLAPEGWRIPTDNDWSKLAMFLGGSDIAGSKMRERSGFNAQFAGYRRYGDFDFYNEIGVWGSSTRDNYTLWCRAVDTEQPQLERTNDDCYMTDGFSVRCIKND
jgi:uncharacterized protein (TIGR02145 family)